MTEQERRHPDFHALMMAAAFAEEGLADVALELLGEPSIGGRERAAAAARSWSGLGFDGRQSPPRAT